MSSEDHPVRTHHVWTVFVWMFRIAALFLAFSLIFGPILVAHALIETRWAILTTITWIGLLAFLARFGPYLLGRAIAHAIVSDIEALADDD